MDFPEISKIEILPVRPQKGLFAFVDFLIDECFAVHGVAIHSRPDGSGIRLVYPDKVVNGFKIQLFHPIDRNVGDFITQKVWEKLKTITDETGVRK